MLQSCLGLHPSLGIPDKTARNEIHKILVLASEDLSKGLCSRSPSTTLGIHHRPWGTIVIEEKPFAGAAVDEILIRGSQDFHDARQLLLFVFAREDGEASV